MREQIADFLEKQFYNKQVYQQMPENNEGYYHIPREEILKIVDSLIPLIKGFTNKKRRKDVINAETLKTLKKDTPVIIIDSIPKPEKKETDLRLLDIPEKIIFIEPDNRRNRRKKRTKIKKKQGTNSNQKSNVKKLLDL